jgi:hypothetical protein
MYRETILGGALATALEQLQHCRLTEDQLRIIWQAFDQSFEEALRDAPIKTRIIVKTKKPGNHSTSPQIASSAKVPHAGALSEAGLAGEDLQLPVYRSVDGVLTLVLKDAEVTILNPGKAEETVHVDYLKCYLKEPQGKRLKRERQ